MKKYEYMKLSDMWGEPVPLELLNRYGKDGWELKHIHPCEMFNPNFHPKLCLDRSTLGMSYFFQRELLENSEKEMD